MSELVKVVLGEDELPRQWYNLVADLQCNLVPVNTAPAGEQPSAGE